MRHLKFCNSIWKKRNSIYYAYEPAGFDAESWKVTVEYLNSGNKDHKKLIQTLMMHLINMQMH